MKSETRYIVYFLTVLAVSSLLYVIADFILRTQFIVDETLIDLYNQDQDPLRQITLPPLRFAPAIPDYFGQELKISFGNGKSVFFTELLIYFLPSGLIFIIGMHFIKTRFRLIQAALTALLGFVIVSQAMSLYDPMIRGAYIFSVDFMLMASGIFLAPFIMHAIPFYRKMLTPAA